jgi:ribosomal protein S13
VANLLKSKKVQLALVFVAAVGLSFAAFIWLGKLGAPLQIETLETQKSLSSRVENPPVQQQFKTGEPIMLFIKYRDAAVGATLDFAVEDDSGQTVKAGSVAPLRASDNLPSSGQRYVSIVNTADTALPAGKYRVILSSGDRQIATHQFVID